jgi:hypothetical protein
MRIAAGAVCLLLASHAAFTQEKPAARAAAVYRVDLAMHQTEQGKRVSTQNYSLLIQDGNRGAIRLGSKVPIATSNSSTQFVDVGFSLDCRLQERDSLVWLDASVEMSNVDADQQGKAAPVIRQTRSSTVAAIAPGKPTTIATMDDLTAKRRYEIEVTATKVQ